MNEGMNESMDAPAVAPMKHLNLIRGSLLAYERRPKSVRTVWGVRAAFRVSTSGAAGSTESVPQRSVYKSTRWSGPPP